MSWYNQDNTDFIDATQQFQGGSGSASIVIDGSGANFELTDILELRQDHLENEYDQTNPTLALNLYLKNENVGGEIRFLVLDGDSGNDNSNLEYNVKIGNDGKLYLYYTYNFLTSATILSGWIEISDYLVGARQGVNNNSLAIATAGLTIAANSTRITTLEATTTGLTTATQAITNDLQVINANITTLNATTAVLTAGSKKRIKNLIRQILDNVRGNATLNIARNQIRVRTENAVNALSTAVSTSSTSATMLQRIANLKFAGEFLALIVGGGGVAGLVLGYIYKYIDDENKRAREEEITESIRYLEEIQNDPTYQVVDNIHLQGLTIVSSTNNNFTTTGEFEEVSIINSAILHIKISGNPLVASIENVIDGGSGFNVGDIIIIPKTDLGGGTGNLQINVTSLISRVKAFTNLIDENRQEILNTDNRNRRRQFIPDKNDFNNGLEVTETNVTEPSGEITKQLDISLKIDSSQFQYDSSGNLQIQNYGTIPINTSQFQYDSSGNLELLNYNQIATNTADIFFIKNTNLPTIQNDISTIQSDISTIQADQLLQNTNITNNYNNINTILNTEIPGLQNSITTNATNITNNGNAITTINNTLGTLATQNNLTEIYQLILNDGETPSNTTTKQVNIGFNKSEFNNIIFPLIMGAVKLTSTQEIAFNITDFQGFYFGTYPDMTRLNYNDTITLVKQDNSYYYNDTNWNSGGLIERGAYYFKNEQTGFVYDLNKRFEYLGFHRFKTNISGQNTYIIRSGLEFEEQVGVFNYQPDPDKLQFYLRDNKFYFSHLCKYDLTYYAIRYNQNILNDFINPIVSFTSTISPSGNNRGILNLNVTTPPLNEDYYLRIDDTLEGITRTQMENLFDTNTHSNERFCGMVQNFQGQISTTHEPFGSITLFQSTYTTNYRIARIELEYQFKVRDQTNSFWSVSNPTTQADLNNIVEELVFEFYDLITDTTPTQTIPLNNRVTFTGTTNTISINFDKSPDIHTYLNKKWRIRPRFIASYNGYTNQGNIGYNYVPFQRSAFIVKAKLFPYIQKTITRELVEEFTDNTTHTLSAFDYNKINLHVNLNNHISPFNDIWYKLNDNLDANKYQITIPQSFNTTNFTGITDLPPNVTSLPTDSFNFLTDDFFISSGQQSITELNNILIIGEEDIGITQYETHFGWRYLLPIDNVMSETDLDNYDYLKTYNYYHRTAICDRFFSCKEFFADIIDFKNLLVDGNLAYNDMTTGEFSTLSQNSDGFSLKSLSSVNIQNLYGLTGTGFLFYDSVNGFTLSQANVTNYWTQVNAVEISYPYTISVDRVNTTTIVLTAGSPSASITFSDGSSITTATGLSYSTYTDTDTKAVLALSGGNNISWNSTTEQFDLDSQVTTDISNNASAITNLNNLIEDVSGSTKIKATSDIIFENNSIEKMRLDVNGNLGIGVTPVEPIDFQHIQNGWLKVNNFAHLLMRNTQTSSRWNLSIRNSGLFSISTFSGGTYDNGIMPSQYNVLSILPSGNVGIGTNNPNSKLDVTGSINASDSFTFGGSINTIPALTFSYLANVTSDIQTQINNISSYTDTDTRAVLSTSAGTDINWNATTNQFDLNPQITTDITTLNNLIYDDIPTSTTYIDAITNFVVNLNGVQSLKCQNNLIEIRTPPTSTNIPFFRLVQALNNHQGQFYLSGSGNNDLIMDRNTQANNPNSGVALRVGGQDKIRIDGTGTIVIPNQIGSGNPTNSSYGLEIQHGTTAITGSGSFLMENGIFVVGKLQGTGNSIFDVNSSSGSFLRLNPLGMLLMKNTNNANRYQIGIRNNGELCIGNDTSTTSGTMGGANDKLKVKPSGEVEVKYNLKVGDANGALLTEISLLNLPTSQPATANLIWRDASGFLRIS